MFVIAFFAYICCTFSNIDSFVFSRQKQTKSQRFIGSFLLYYLLHLSIFFLLFPAVAVLEARKLKKMDITGASDPYVKIKLFDNKVSVEYGVVSRPKLITEKAFFHSFIHESI